MVNSVVFFFHFFVQPISTRAKTFYTAHTEMKTPIDLALGFWI